MNNKDKILIDHKAGIKDKLAKMRNKKDEGRCPDCSHDLKFHDSSGCWGSYPNGTDGVSPMEVFYGECHCSHKPKK